MKKLWFFLFSKAVVLDGRLHYQFYIAACNGAAVFIPDCKELWSSGYERILLVSRKLPERARLA
jgi:hypothetical protein